jgi:hypothetical protein
MVDKLFNEPEPSKEEKRIRLLRFYIRVETVVALYTFGTFLGVIAISSLLGIILNNLLGFIFATLTLGIAVVTLTRMLYRNFRIWLIGSIGFYVVFFCISLFFIWSIYSPHDFVRVNFVGAMVWTVLLQVGNWIADMIYHNKNPYAKYKESEFEL